MTALTIATGGTPYPTGWTEASLPDPVIFHDCLGRVIKVGDVLANGQRANCHGRIVIGVVTGFTEKTILVNTLDEGRPAYVTGEDHDKSYREWTWRKGHFNASYNCCITGMTEQQLREITETEIRVFGDD
jgi:hypothetical protein